METNIWKQNRFTNISPDDFVNTTKNVQSFCCSNNLRNSLFKSQGGWYKLKMDGILEFVSSTLNSITFKDLFITLKD